MMKDQQASMYHLQNIYSFYVKKTSREGGEKIRREGKGKWVA